MSTTNDGQLTAMVDAFESSLPEFTTLYDLKHKTIGPIQWVIDGILPRGLTILGGRPKIGKSWMFLGLAMEIAQGAPALSEYQTTRGEVLYIALEDNDRRMKSRSLLLGLRNIPDDAGRRITVIYRWPQINDGGLDQLTEYLDNHPQTKVVFIDTWQRFRGDAGSGPNRYAEDYNIAGQLQQLATERDIALVLAHHLRKEVAEDWIDQLSGTTGITGAADTLWGIFRERGVHDATLRITGRDVEETDIALTQENQRWRSLGDAYLWRTTQERKEIYELLDEVGHSLTTGEVAKTIGKSVANTSKLLHGLAADGLARSPQRGKWEAISTLVDLVDVVESPGQQGSLTSTTPVDTVDTTSTHSTVSTTSTGEMTIENDPSELSNELPDPYG